MDWGMEICCKYSLADKRCTNFKTCGVDGDEMSGQSNINYDIFRLFAVGRDQLSSKDCEGLRRTVEEISNLMYVPLIQGTLRYAYRLGETFVRGGEKDEAAGAIFAGAVLPRVFDVNPQAAGVIYANMRVGAVSTESGAVKSAFESVYDLLGVSCADVGGLWNEADNAYYARMEPCVEDENDATKAPSTIETSSPFGPTNLPVPMPMPSPTTVDPTITLSPTNQATPLLSASTRTLPPTISITHPPATTYPTDQGTSHVPTMKDESQHADSDLIQLPIVCTEEATSPSVIPCLALFENNTCRELEVDSEALLYYLNNEFTGTSDNQQQQPYNLREEYKLFVGPYCTANRKSIYLATFLDKNCTNFAPAGIYEAFTYGMDLPYSKPLNNNDLQNESEVLEFCGESLQVTTNVSITSFPTTAVETAMSPPSTQPSMSPSLSIPPSSNITVGPIVISVPSSSPSSTAPTQLSLPEPISDYTNSGQYNTPLFHILLAIASLNIALSL